VRDLNELPVPLTQFGTRGGHCDAGVHVLVSPLDQRSADIRFFDSDGLQIDKRAERKFENLFFREDFRRAAFYEMGDIEYIDPHGDYRQHLMSSVDAAAIRAANFRVLIDYDYSQASSVLPGILNDLGVTAIPLNAGLTEQPHHRTVPEETALISRTVHADVGCMISPTGERITVIDNEGTVLTAHETFGILISWWMKTHPGIVLAPASTPQWIANHIKESGGSFTPTPAEASAVLRASAAPSTCLAADGEGGFIWPYFFGAYDAMYTLVKLLEMRAVYRVPLSEVRGQLPVATYLTATEFCPWEAKGKVMRRLLEDHAVVEKADLVRDLACETHLVRRDHHRHPALGQLADHVQHLTDELGVERARDLVQEQQIGLHRERADDRGALLLASREPVRVLVLLVGEAEADEEVACVRLGAILRRSQHLPGRERHIAEDGHVREEVERLEDDPDPLTHLVEVDALRAHVLPGHDDPARVDRLQQVDAAQEGRLPRTGRADQRHDLVHGDLEIDPAQHLDLPEGLVQVLDAEDAHASTPAACRRRRSRETSQSVSRVSGIVIATKRTAAAT